jgi:pyrroloquinoline quinone (PQQ) biosynthesis protein C
MTTAMTLSSRMESSEVQRRFVEHAYFKEVYARTLSHDRVEMFLGQWWHPLHYFPTFLARCIAVLPDIESKSAITRILSQEVGSRSPKAAHEVIYLDSMARAGYSRDVVARTGPYPETSALVECYEQCSASRLGAIGAIFATEVTDLLMVSAIGEAVKRESGTERNAWVDIHVQQEPDHVEEANNALFAGFSREEEETVLAAAEDMWRHWTRFFDRLSDEAKILR